MNAYQLRRRALQTQMGAATAIIPSSRQAFRNADTEYAFRQHSDFYYLTGFNEPDAVLLLRRRDGKEESILFLRPRDRKQELWTGPRLGPEAAPAALGVDAAYAINELDERLPDYLIGAPTLYCELGRDEAFDRRVHAALAEARYRVRRGGVAPSALIEPGTLLHEMRLRKSPEELAIMRRAAAISRAGHETGMAATRPGIGEYALEAIVEHQYFAQGAQDVAYPSIVAGGENACILHYNANRDVLRAGTLVLVDSGCELDLYASDVTRTWPVSGRFTPEQRALYEIVLRAQLAAIDKVRAGEPFDAYHQAASRVLAEGLIDLGLLEGTIDACIENKTLEEFYPHRTGHWIGLDVHDAGRYKNLDDTYRTLEPGMTLTVEPGIYVRRDGPANERFKGIGIRIEDDVLCTAGAPEVLTAAIPKTIEELETIVGAGATNRAVSATG